jgi:predicted SAM-dependent methyltransferase
LKSLAQIVDENEAKNMEDNPNLLEPGLTPDKLKNFKFVVGCPCPTRIMTRETALALRRMQYPMFGNPIEVSPDSMEVGEARNFIAQAAIDEGAEYVFFLDYDVSPPPNTLVRLLHHEAPVAAAVYNLKSVPSYPLIFVRGYNHAFEEWEQGDLIKADGVGMGATLIKTEVFKNLEKPWFRTVPGYGDNGRQVLPQMTEDIWFCDKVRDAGFDILVDTSLQCSHVDFRTGVMYQRIPDPNDPKKGVPGWIYRKGDVYVAETIADAKHPGAHWAKTDPFPVPASPNRIDLGSGVQPAEGFIGIDLHANGAPNVMNGDISDLAWYRTEHGLAEKIRSSHSLEHMSHRDVPRVFRDWVNTLEVGGEMEVRVPDGEYHIRAVLERVDNEEDVDPQCDWLNATIYGYQIGEGQEHKTLFTKRRLEQLALTSGLVDVEVEHVVNPGDGVYMPDTAELVLTGKRGE